MQVKWKKQNVIDTVRINLTSKIFEKAIYLWSTKLFKISKVLSARSVMYHLLQMKYEDNFVSFYEYEFQKVKNDAMFQNEKILKSQSYTSERQLFVRWLGYNSDFYF